MSRDDDHTPRHFAGRPRSAPRQVHPPAPTAPGSPDDRRRSSRPPVTGPTGPNPPSSGQRSRADAPSSSGGDTGRRRGGWILPAALAVLTIGGAAGAVALDADPAATAIGVDHVVATPVLSARRAPEAVAAPVADRRLVDDLQGWLVDSPTDTCLVVATEGREVFAHNPDAPVAGASTQKLITATGLLLALGPDATLRTDAVAAAPPAGGVVAGDLFVVGGGQADLATPDWAEAGPGLRRRVIHDVDGLVSAIAAAGITRIEGSVVGDGTRYDDERYQTSLAPRLIDQDQIGPIGGLMVNDGFAGFSAARTNADTVPAADPAADAARVITERLQAHGITVAGAPRAGTAPEGAAAVASLESPPLSQVVADMLTMSDNETAEASLKEIGLATSGEGTWAAGVAGLTALLAEHGVGTDGVQVVDGSGLTIDNRLTCGTLVDVLTLEGTGPVVRDGLAVAGETGTLADRWAGTEVAGRLRGKTGTLRNVTALAGEVDPIRGGGLTFAYVANVPDPGEVTAGEVGIDDLAHILVRYPRGVDMAALEPLPATPAG